MPRCAACQSVVSSDATFCSRCGQRVAQLGPAFAAVRQAMPHPAPAPVSVPAHRSTVADNSGGPLAIPLIAVALLIALIVILALA